MMSKVRESYISASTKVRSVNQNKVALAKLQRAEADRIQNGKTLDKLSEDTLAELERILSAAKVDSATQIGEYFTKRLAGHEKMVEALTRAGEDVGQIRKVVDHHAQLKETKLMQNVRMKSIVELTMLHS